MIAVTGTIENLDSEKTIHGLWPRFLQKLQESTSDNMIFDIMRNLGAQASAVAQKCLSLLSVEERNQILARLAYVYQDDLESRAREALAGVNLDQCVTFGAIRLVPDAERLLMHVDNLEVHYKDALRNAWVQEMLGDAAKIVKLTTALMNDRQIEAALVALVSKDHIQKAVYDRMQEGLSEIGVYAQMGGLTVETATIPVACDRYRKEEPILPKELMNILADALAKVLNMQNGV